ncbi:hypothetical protein HU200_058285 [Digitaria exilis]|uniref:Uncharacterized protein n=1 Tax=Digitaria exilis TaxID=1010633 RepID=A0A835E432_9POAL|nr:hypothetical protein HU200_058285 [Digitaria exilis]CAB3462006.1 unnamed protein product [Digitaria exilis]
MELHDPEAGLLPPHQRDLSFRLSTSNSTFRSAQHRHSRPLIIQKVPSSVRGGLDEHYFLPDVVSIGPYHHRAAPHLVEMEQVKEAVAHEFCRSAVKGTKLASLSTSAVDLFLEAVRPVLPEARLCYAADVFGGRAIADNDFANMMVVDGCFLLAVVAILTKDYPDDLEHWSWTHGRMLRIMKDILLFENQIPWAVVRALMSLRPVRVDVFVAKVLAYLDVHSREPRFDQTPWHKLRPVHLLDLVHQRHLGGPPPAADGHVRYCDYARPFAHFTSAVELAEAGIRIHGSGTCRVTDVRVEPTPAAAAAALRIGRLALPQLALSWLPRCWLINMVALECVTDRSDQSGVSSYLAILGSLIRTERDVEELRKRRILFSTMSDQRTAEFFEVLMDPLPRQELYLRTLEGIVQLRATRRTRSRLHAVYYRNRRIILAAAPLLSLLVAIIGIALTNSLKRKSSA